MNRSFRNNLTWLSAVIVLIALCIIFPGVTAFAELAARQLRYLWWLILIAVIGIYFAFFYGRRND